ncbi:DUF6300 family protein (plasmid) [Streptomyces sp. NBC_00015]|uniref:DUF6300 family protein n=1 Tax=Streptomyces sp. NBC_00015 TaxID=2903611 RepID=UPI002F9170DC
MTERDLGAAAHALASDDELHIRITDVPHCLVCGAPGLLLVRYRHSWMNQSGGTVPGIRETLLCPQCSRENSSAAELIALFAVDEQMSHANIVVFAGIITAWVESLRQEKVDEELLRSQHDQWLHGML